MMSSFALPKSLRAKLQSREVNRNKSARERKAYISESYCQNMLNLKEKIKIIMGTIKNKEKDDVEYNVYMKDIHTYLNSLQNIFDDNKSQFSNYDVRTYCNANNQYFKIKQHQNFLQEVNKFIRENQSMELLNFDSVDSASLYRKLKELPDCLNQDNNFKFFSEKPFLENLENVNITITQDLKDKDLLLQNIKHSTIYINGSLSNLRCIQIQDCIIKSGPISSSAFLDKCCNSEIHLISQQLRIHNCKDLKLYILIVSRTVIEDSKDLLFSPYTWEYGELENHLKSVQISKSNCDWKKVDDFDWINPFEPSPNYIIQD